MNKCISASSQVRKLVSLYIGIKYYHTGKAASSVVIQIQGTTVLCKALKTWISGGRLPWEHGQPSLPKDVTLPKVAAPSPSKVLQISST